MGAAIVPLVIGLVVLAVIAAAVVVAGRRQQQVRRRVVDTDSVRFRVPAGQDATSLLASLHTAGYDAALTTADTDSVVAVAVEGPTDREAVRSVIASAPLNPEGDPPPPREVRFLDE